MLSPSRAMSQVLVQAMSAPFARSVASCAYVRHSRLLDRICCKLSTAASRTSRGRYLIARCVTPSEAASVELSRALARKIVSVSTTSSVWAPVKIRSFGRSDYFITKWIGFLEDTVVSAFATGFELELRSLCCSYY